jgi:hypothetical protein
MILVYKATGDQVIYIFQANYKDDAPLLDRVADAWLYVALPGTQVMIKNGVWTEATRELFNMADCVQIEEYEGGNHLKNIYRGWKLV